MISTTSSLNSETHTFPAVRGIQAGREYYVVMCQLHLIPKIFVFHEADMPPNLRAQRILNKARIPEIVSYLVNNTDDYVFSSLTASIDGDVEFSPEGKNGHVSKIGRLTVSMNARFLINDGQHRRAAIQEALEKKPELGSEYISVVFFIDRGLKHCQQVFSDLNKHAVRPSKSLNILYNNRDGFSRSIVEALQDVPIFHGYTDLERTSLSNRSTKVFTLNGVYHATRALLGRKEKNPDITDEERRKISDFWNQVYLNMEDWQAIVQKRIRPYIARQEYVHVHGVLLQALGLLGYELIEQFPKTWSKKLVELNKIDWKRGNKHWEGRAMIGGRLSKVHMNIMLSKNYIKQQMGMKLTSKELGYENCRREK